MSARFPSILVVFALPAEAQGYFEAEGISVLYTGIGKVNAAITLTRRLAEYRCHEQHLPLVVNFGTAGSHRFKSGSIVACHAFVQRDMDVSGLGFDPGVTPFEDLPSRLEFPPVFDDLTTAVCGSGDSFVMQTSGMHYDVVDMEAYALAKVCLLERTRFACVKYVTDGADSNAAQDWQANLPHAAQTFLSLYCNLSRRLQDKNRQ